MTGHARIAEALARDAGHALVPFVTAGYPHPDATGPLLRALDAAGATLIELGLPFTDSLADGPVVQGSYHQAIEGGTTVDRALDQLAEVAAELTAPVVLMGSLNPLLARGLARSVKRAARAGAAGLLVPDLPAEDAHELRAHCADHGLAAIPLAAPNTPPDRYPLLAEGAGGFLYQISRAGTTGVRTGGLPKGLAATVAHARAATGLPVCLGFGISTPAQVKAANKIADGAVVGSALLRELASARSAAGAARKAGAFVKALVGAKGRSSSKKSPGRTRR